jgi:preprotein translocase subunit SecA
MIRKDFPDQVYRTRQEKFQAIIASIKELHAKGQPVLVGTISIEISEYLSTLLRAVDVPHTVLNAKHHAQEAEIVAQAGQTGHVTIATNMAGRGTDIVLGSGVVALGGLHILGTERHESRRIDNQLRGRSGRQGDPGSSRFYLSLEDDLMRLFGSDRLSSIMQKLGMEEGEPIENAMVTRAIENAQKRVEGHNFEIRKTLLDYDNVMNQQREVIYTLRRELMQEDDLEPVALEFLDDLLEDIYAPLNGASGADPDTSAGVRGRLRDVLHLDRAFASKLPDAPEALPDAPQELPDAPLPDQDAARTAVIGMLNDLHAQAGPVYKDILRYFLLGELDRCWKEHLRDMDFLRDGIGLQGYAQRDPKLEYKKQGFQLFQALLLRIREGAFRTFTRLRIEQPEEKDFQHKETIPTPAAPAPASASLPGAQAGQRLDPKIGRNELCPCGSGKKYKKCCGLK